MRFGLMFGLPMWLFILALAVGGYFAYRKFRSAD